MFFGTFGFCRLHRVVSLHGFNFNLSVDDKLNWTMFLQSVLMKEQEAMGDRDIQMVYSLRTTFLMVFAISDDVGFFMLVLVLVVDMLMLQYSG